jgi:hypothetical protein
MTCKCSCSTCPGSRSFTRVFLALMVFGIVTQIAKMVGGAVASISLPPAAWLPAAALALGGTVWGLWVGARQHGNGSPLAVGLFGLLVAASGLVFGAPVLLVGMLVVLLAAVWSALAVAVRR